MCAVFINIDRESAALLALGLALVAAALAAPGAVTETIAGINQVLAKGIDATLRGVGL